MHDLLISHLFLSVHNLLNLYPCLWIYCNLDIQVCQISLSLLVCVCVHSLCHVQLFATHGL